MAEITGASRTVSQRSEPLAWLRQMLLGLGRPQRDRHLQRIHEKAWSDYMLRDIGLDESRLSHGANPRDLPFDWPLR